MDGITIPFLRRPVYDNRVVLTVAGTTRTADIPDIEHMLTTDGYAQMKPDGHFRLSKSGNTIYAELPDQKIRFPYGVFAGMLKSTKGNIVGKICEAAAW